MRHLTPAFILEQFKKKQFKGEFQATTMFIDIAGFTWMTQALMDNGKEGAEVLAYVINKVFTPAIATIYAHGGFVSSFSGDAFTAIFPGDSVPVVQALSAAVRLRESFREKAERQTRFGSFDLSVRIGLSHGDVSWGIIQHYSQNSYYFGGGAIMHSIESEQNAVTGEVIVDQRILSQISGIQGEEVTCKHKNLDFHTLLSAPVTISIMSETEVAEFPLSLQRMFIPDEVLSLPGGGEFRDIVSCFISFDERGCLERGVAKVITQVNRFGGYFNKIDFSSNGGMMLVLFGAPVNPGNLYNRALNFAIAVRDIPELTVRIGLTYGTAFTGFIGSELCSEYTALGSVVNLSARFIQKKKQAVIYLDKYICKQSHFGYEIRELKPLTFKGFTGKIPLYRLIGKKRVTQSSFSSGGLVDRNSELNQLTELIQPLRQGKFGGIVYVYGSPGIGKSRLVDELIQQQRIRVAVMQTDSILRKPLNPFIYFFSNYFKSSQSSSHDEKKANFKKLYQKLIHKIENLPEPYPATVDRLSLSMELDRIESIIGALLGFFWNGSIYDLIDPLDRTAATELAVKEFFKALSLIEPVIVLIEDIQWLDSASLAVFKALTRRIDNHPLIILACSRFNDDGSKPKLNVDEGIHSISMILKNLSASATKELIVDRLGKMVDDELAAYIHFRTEGNPFYTEQFCLYLQESGIIEVRNGIFHLLQDSHDIPSSINMILIARIDRLSADLKETVQIASVLGREFEVKLLSTLLKLMETSRELECAEIDSLIIRAEHQGIWSPLTEIRYIFKHALLRDAVYDMQLRTRLRSIHKLAGDAIAEHNPDEETTFADCAFHYEQAGDWENARKYCTSNGVYLMESVRYDEALIYHLKALSICQSELGEKHPDTASAYSYVGDVYSVKGNYDKAMDCHNRALAIRLDLLGEKHPDTATAYDKIGGIQENRGDYSKALASNEKALEIRLELFGEMHPDTAASYNNIGVTYYERGNDDIAMNYYRKALAIRLELLGESHVDTAESYGNIGMIHWEKGDCDASVELNKKALNILIELRGERHPAIAQSYNNIGMTYKTMGNFKAAFDNLNKALVLMKELLGENHPNTARLYNNIGTIHAENGDLETALVYLERALSIREELLGEKSRDTALSYNNIGILHSMNGDYDAALFLHMKALAVQKELLGEEHPHTVRSYTNVGNDFRDKESYFKALFYYEKALAIRKNTHGDKHESTLKLLTVIASVCSLQHKYEEADRLFVQTLNTSRDSYGDNHPSTVYCMQKMVEMYDAMGNDVKAKEIQQQLEAVDS